MKKLYILLCGANAALLMAACQGGKTAAADAEAGDTLEMKYAVAYHREAWRWGREFRCCRRH